MNGSGSVTVRHRQRQTIRQGEARTSEREERERERERGDEGGLLRTPSRVLPPLSLVIFCALSASFPAAVTHPLIGLCSFSQICALRRPKHSLVCPVLLVSLSLSLRGLCLCVCSVGVCTYVRTLAVAAVAHFKLLSLEISARCLCVCCVWWKEVSKPFFFSFFCFVEKKNHQKCDAFSLSPGQRRRRSSPGGGGAVVVLVF